jgi:hypothetical protein
MKTTYQIDNELDVLYARLHWEASMDVDMDEQQAAHDSVWCDEVIIMRIFELRTAQLLIDSDMHLLHVHETLMERVARYDLKLGQTKSDGLKLLRHARINAVRWVLE